MDLAALAARVARTASSNPAEVFMAHESAIDALDALVEGMEVAVHKAYEEGIGEDAHALMLEQVELVRAALGSIRPQMADLDDRISASV